MLKGRFFGNTPLIQVAVASNQGVQMPFVVLDTGFTSDLKVTKKIATELGLEVIGVTRVGIANGQTIEAPVALAASAMEGIVKDVEVIISEGLPAAGIGFFTKFSYKAIFDCKNRDVTLERVITS
mgnify:CR=1 FL=1